MVSLIQREVRYMKKPFVPNLMPISLSAEDKLHLLNLALEARSKNRTI